MSSSPAPSDRDAHVAASTSREVELWDALHAVAYPLFNESQLGLTTERCLELWSIARAALYPMHALGEGEND